MSRRGFQPVCKPGTRYWTPERNAILRHLWDKGVAGAVIGASLEPPKTAEAVHSQAYRLGLPTRQFRHDGKKVDMSVQVSRADRQMVARRARVRGMSVSQYIRNLVKLDVIRDPL